MTNKDVDTIKLVITTLQEVEIKASHGNMSRLMGCLAALSDIVNQTEGQQGQETKESEG